MSRADSLPFSVERFKELLQTRWVGRELHYQPVVGSTMDVARSLARAGSRPGTVVSADEQTAGRGRLGRRWLTPPGSNLAVSILLLPELDRLKSLAMVAPLAVVEGIRTACGLDCSIKWPNDVQAAGRKLAGILLESELEGERPRFAIAGIGINVNYDTAAEPGIAAIATSVMRETGRRHEREALLAACLIAFEHLYEAPAHEVFAKWRATLNTLGRQIRVTFQGIAEEGLAEDVDADGSLLLRRADGSLVPLPAGEVTLRA